MVTANGCKRHISQIFDLNDPYIDEDAVFGVRSDLAVPYDRQPSEDELSRFSQIQRPFNITHVDFVLASA